MRRETEIEALLSNVEDSGASKFPGMSYEEGLRAALEWVLELDPDAPDPLED